MCFAPQRRALFRRCNFQKCSDTDVFCTFWLPHAQRRALFRHRNYRNYQKCSKRDVLLASFSFFTSKCASRQNGVKFFISHLASWLRTRRFSEPTFQPSGAPNHWKTQCFATFLPFLASASSFFLLFLFYSSFFSSSLLLFSDSSHLCFSSVHIVGSLTSKLPSITTFIPEILNLRFDICMDACMHAWMDGWMHVIYAM